MTIKQERYLAIFILTLLGFGVLTIFIVAPVIALICVSLFGGVVAFVSIIWAFGVLTD